MATTSDFVSSEEIENLNKAARSATKDGEDAVHASAVTLERAHDAADREGITESIERHQYISQLLGDDDFEEDAQATSAKVQLPPEIESVIGVVPWYIPPFGQKFDGHYEVEVAHGYVARLLSFVDSSIRFGIYLASGPGRNENESEIGVVRFIVDSAMMRPGVRDVSVDQWNAAIHREAIAIVADFHQHGRKRPDVPAIFDHMDPALAKRFALEARRAVKRQERSLALASLRGAWSLLAASFLGILSLSARLLLVIAGVPGRVVVSKQDPIKVQLARKAAGPLSHEDRLLINAYCVGHVGADKVKHLLKD